MKKSYQYRVQLNRVQNKEGGDGNLPEPIDFEFESHDDIFRIIALQEERNFLGDKQQARELALGLKLLGGVMLKNRDSDLFSEFEPAFINLMKKIKGRIMVSITQVEEE